MTVNFKTKITALLGGLLLLSGLQADVLEWDFSKGINPLNNRMQFKISGTAAEIKDGYLRQPVVNRTTPGGIFAVEKYPELTPAGAFRIAFEITLEPPRNQDRLLFLWDNKGDYYGDKSGKPQKNSGFTIGMYRAPNGKVIVPKAWLGFGKETFAVSGVSVAAVPGKKYLFEFYYNGSGLAAFYIDGKLNREVAVFPGGPVAPALYKTAIGNRTVGNYLGFDGKIHSVKMMTAKAEHLVVRAAGRKVFQRGEKNAVLKVEIRNVSHQETEGLKVGGKKIISVPVRTNLTAGDYKVDFSFNGKKYSLTYTIAPLIHEKMPILMWGFGDSFHILRETGFTHMLNSYAGPQFFRPKENHKAKMLSELDEMYKYGFFFSDYFTLPHYPQVTKKYPRLTRDGKPYLKGRKMNLDAQNPQAQKDMREWAEKFALTYDGHPALQMLDICSEIRDWSMPSFSKYERDACRKATGADIPAKVNGRSIHYLQIPGLPVSRIIPDNNPYLVYYRWFWSNGDGWNPLFSIIADGYRKHLPSTFKSYFAPAVRQPPCRAVGGNADFLGQWSYSNPEPMLLAATADELLATGNGRPVIQGTQLILYRNASAPKNVKVSPEPAWVAKEKDANYITNPPDTLIQSVWATLSRPVHGMIFHGDGSFYPPPIKGASIYRCTNDKSEPALRKLIQEVIQPLGPALRKVKGKKSEVAILHSFTSSVLALRGSYGWGGWLPDLHIALQTAGLDPHVIFEEDILEGKTDHIKIIFLSHCDVLTESLYKKLMEFQVRGGIVVADEFAPPAILPNLRFHTVARGRDVLQNKKNLVKLGAKIRKQLAGHYVPRSETSAPDLISHLRDDYLFVINDKRTFGDYIGQWKRFAEKALPNKGTVTVNRKAGAVYDLVKRCAVPFKVVNGKTVIDVAFDGAGGKLFLLLDSPLKPFTLVVKPNGEVIAKSGTSAVIPVQLTVRDPKGKETDDTHYGAAVNGEFRYKINIPENAAKGKWSIELKSLPDQSIVKGALIVK